MRADALAAPACMPAAPHQAVSKPPTDLPFRLIHPFLLKRLTTQAPTKYQMRMSKTR